LQFTVDQASFHKIFLTLINNHPKSSTIRLFSTRIKMKYIYLSLLVISLGIHAIASKPNVIVIMADDLGFGDIGCYGAKPKNLKTPHIDQLAEEGLRFTSGYCSASTCTPTRYSFLTGNYAFRRAGTGIAPPNGPSIIQPGEKTIGDLLKRAGYKTAVIGKWHLGLGAPGKGPDWNGELKPGPREIGFDYNFLLPTTNDRVPQVYVENSLVLNLDPSDPLWVGMKKPSEDHPTGITHRHTLKMDWSHGHNSTIHNGISRIGFYTGGHSARFRDEDLADKWVEKSEEWIKENKKDPFFLFFASHDLHVPRIPHERFKGKSGLSYRGDVIVQLDWCVGEIVRILREQGLEKNTMIVFCSDNGPVGDDGYKDGALEFMGDHKPAGPYKGGKYSIFEGGTRTPFITWWPGTIEPGISDEVVCTIDLATSLASHLGLSLPEESYVDSLDVMDALLGKEGAKGREHLIQQDNGGKGNFGFRKGKWKLLRHAKKMARNVKVEEQLASENVDRLMLVDLEKDPGERTNLAQSNPEMTEKLNSELQALLDRGRSR
jgi:arylsulfatase A-like enzyme